MLFGTLVDSFSRNMLGNSVQALLAHIHLFTLDLIDQLFPILDHDHFAFGFHAPLPL
jgi:hypothetical protein